MKLENRFTVPVPRADAWKVLMDVERVAPCMPGATLTSRDGDEFTGTVKVKVGPINLTYGGQAKFVSLDEENGIAVIEGSGKETRGTGTAKALITCRLIDKGQTTDVEVETDLAVTGKPAQFGRGVLADVSAKLVDRFAASLSEEIAAGDFDEDLSAPVGGGAAPAASSGVSGPSPTSTTDVDTAALFETGPVGSSAPGRWLRHRVGGRRSVRRCPLRAPPAAAGPRGRGDRPARHRRDAGPQARRPGPRRPGRPALAAPPPAQLVPAARRYLRCPPHAGSGHSDGPRTRTAGDAACLPGSSADDLRFLGVLAPQER